jgi:hypothetical protein
MTNRVKEPAGRSKINLAVCLGEMALTLRDIVSKNL